MKTTIVITARRWFQRTYGNTYHSVEVIIQREGHKTEFLRNKFCYGYGEQYLQTAEKLLVDAGIFPEDYSIFRDKIDNRDRYLISVVDVNRKKDL